MNNAAYKVLLIEDDKNDQKDKSINQVLCIIDERTKQQVESVVDKVLRTGKTESGTDSDALVAADGSERAVAITAATIHKDHDTAAGVVMVLRDVANMREIDRMKADLVSSVSHELRTPLTSIKAVHGHNPRRPQYVRRNQKKVLEHRQ